MEELIEKTPADLEKEFYSKKLYLSYSGLSKMLYSPSLFYRYYVLQQRDEELGAHLLDGKVIHCLLLDDGSFDKQFMLSPATLPTGNTKLVVEKVMAHRDTLDSVMSIDTLMDFTDVIIATLKEIKLHQTLKTDAQRIEKIATPEAESYFQFLKIKGDKEIIDQETLKRCNDAVTAVRENSTACNLLALIRHEMENIDIFNEVPMQSDLQNVYPFGIKGIIDNIKIDYDKYIVYINDLKTTGKTVTEFKESVEFYNYWAQAAMYHEMVKDNFKDLLTDEWQVVFTFIVVDKYNQVYSFEVCTATMNEWKNKLDEKLKEVAWHYTSKSYRLPYLFEKTKVML